MMNRLNKKTLNSGLRYLSKIDKDLAKIQKQIGPPPLWRRDQGFISLVHIILEQQVSLASAKAALARLLETIAPATPEKFLELDDGELRKIGFSRQKTQYCRNLAISLVTRQIRLERLENLDENSIRAELTSIKGIGNWTVDIYLIMVLGRPDIWPVGDLALAKAVQGAKNMDARPDHKEMTRIGDNWRPWRSVAAFLLWHHYLNG